MPHSSLTVGKVEISVLHDAEAVSPFKWSYPDVPIEAWEPYLKRYPEAFKEGSKRYWQAL